MPPRRSRVVDYEQLESDDELLDIDLSGPDSDLDIPRTRQARKRDDQPKAGEKEKKTKEKRWEGQLEYTWDEVTEDASGSLQGAVADLVLGARSKRVIRDTASIQRGLIRHVFLVIDVSEAMAVREYRQTWLDLTLEYVKEFITEFFDQNPISQLSLVITRDGTAERLSPLTANPADHYGVLSTKKRLEPRGSPSLQNSFELARNGLMHLPPHGSREIIVIMASLTTTDPGDLRASVHQLAQDKIRVNIIGLSAEMKICYDICQITKGTYIVAKDDTYLKDALFSFLEPPPVVASGPHLSSSSDLMQMGFPSYKTTNLPTLCSCHSQLKDSGFRCPRCESWICDVPTECGVCGMVCVSSPHLARSYRHLFPVDNYIRITEIQLQMPANCFACSFVFPTMVVQTKNPDISPAGRYQCKNCSNHFCLDCDVLVHEGLGFCPGCK